MAFDCYDGRKAVPEKRSEYQEANRLKQVPMLLEIMGHTFIISTYFFGPQTSMAKYKTALERNRRKAFIFCALYMGFQSRLRVFSKAQVITHSKCLLRMAFSTNFIQQRL